MYTVLPTVKNLIFGVRNLLIPRFCYVCRAYDNVPEGLCLVCRAEIRPIVSMPVVLPIIKTVSIHAASAYDGPLKTLAFKKNYGVAGASRVLGAMIYEHTAVQHKQFDVIVPVPLHWTRYAWRWFNQSELIARVLQQKTGTPVVRLVRRSRRTPFQVGLTKEQRHANLRHVFTLSPDARQYAGKRILVVDDIYTTGTTIKEVCRVLATMNPESIDVAVACRVV